MQIHQNGKIIAVGTRDNKLFTMKFVPILANVNQWNRIHQEVKSTSYCLRTTVQITCTYFLTQKLVINQR